MNPTLSEMIASQTLFSGITIACLYVAWCFYNFKDGKLRVLIIWLFLSLAWSYGTEGIYWLLWDFKIIDGIQSIWIRLIKNLPFMICVLRFVRYTKK